MSIQNSHQISDIKVMLLKGEGGSGIESVEKTGTSGLVDTYTITFTDGRKTTFTVTNGRGIVSIEKTASVGLVDTYTITFNDGTTTTFEVHNGNNSEARLIAYDNTQSGLSATTVQGAIDENANNSNSYHTFSVASTDWTANQDSTTSTDYPYIATVSSALFSANSHPIWQMNGAGTIPTATERESINLILEAVFGVAGVTLYATGQPSDNLVLEVKGV